MGSVVFARASARCVVESAFEVTLAAILGIGQAGSAEAEGNKEEENLIHGKIMLQRKGIKYAATRA